MGEVPHICCRSALSGRFVGGLQGARSRTVQRARTQTFDDLALARCSLPCAGWAVHMSHTSTCTFLLCTAESGSRHWATRRTANGPPHKADAGPEAHIAESSRVITCEAMLPVHEASAANPHRSDSADVSIGQRRMAKPALTFREEMAKRVSVKSNRVQPENVGGPQESSLQLHHCA